ncbi:aryl-alcohol dehydrogenase-like predicted oxidoreductase [Actinoallomurus bryophytorum]|uniref:Aryl-alcohol dehydrogenase-like predicted oxidoreductase n=1 Tax=Actinoallomurus bryophytorum TaxID=1490222 RepID=A0A543CIB0_9ACTN|nr:aldo/keto reductase [Actinoallomurus bryophytorum]TQL96842.1 aryl-alcohol dehydrogenase-like predicted oxidoreductase [Actinoallomurus bryophytorum]
MEKRALGQQGLRTSALGLGCMGMSWAYGTPDDDESVATIHRAIELGCDFLDTAESYGPWANERLLGRALKGRRDEVVIATKFGWEYTPEGERIGPNSRPDHIREVIDQQLTRLGTDHVDLLYQHRVDPQVPIEDVAGTVGELVAAGKVGYFGLSEASADSIRRAHATFPVSALQTEYSLWERGLEQEILPTLRELGIGLVPYSPLGRGFLTGDVRRAEDYSEDDYRRNDPRFQGANFEVNVKAAEKVGEMASRKGATVAQVALAWLLHQGDDLVPIPGTKSRTRLEENLAAVDVELTEAERAELELPVSGERYPEGMLRLIAQG